MSLKKSVDVDAVHLKRIKDERALAIAQGEGVKWGLIGFFTGGVGTLAATYKSKSFAKYMSVSAKTSIPIMLGVFLFGLKYELAISSINRKPELWGLSDEHVKETVKTGQVFHVPAHHRILNALYDNPFLFIAGVGAPWVGLVLNEQLKMPNLKLSQRIMHTRVLGQMGIVGILISTMAFRDWMDRRGRFPDGTEATNRFANRVDK